jgi:hypothetical protein
MAHIPIHNETDYVFTPAMTQQIIRDTQEHVWERRCARSGCKLAWSALP